MSRKTFKIISCVLLLMTIVTLCVIYLTPAEAAATICDIELDKDTLEIKIKEIILKDEPVDLDRIVLELAEERVILNKINGTSQDITNEEYETIRKSVQDSYYKNENENAIFLKKYNITKEENEKIIITNLVLTKARGRYMELISEELLSEYKQKYGKEQPVDSIKLLEQFNQRVRQMVSELPAITYNRKEIDKMILSLEKWKQNIDDTIVLPEINLSY